MTAGHTSTAPAPLGIRAALRSLATPLKWSLIILRQPLEKRPAGGAWGTAIEQVVKDLESLNRSSESDFLAVGEKLMEFRSTARQIASDMTAVTDLISGEHGRNASHALTRMLEQSKELDARIERSGQSLAEVRDLSCRIRCTFTGLRNTVSVFRTLCTLTQIETSRLGSSGAEFGDLAAEVRPLSEMIRSSGEGVLEASSRLAQDVQSAIQRGSGIRVRQLQELPALIAGVTEGLKSFEERRQRAVESSGRQALQYEAVCKAVEDVVRSVQFHDITRQQIEHVAQALRQLRSASEGVRGNPDSLPPDARAILTLQSSQLSEAARVFASSIEHIERDLGSIAERVEDTAEASRMLMGISAADRDSFFHRMEGLFTAILKMVGACSAAQTEMESAAAGLQETIGRMRDSIAEIRGIEIRIQRIAINATIRATHIGEAGNPLNVIAEAIERLALDSSANTEDAAGSLDAMSDAAGRVSGGSGPAASGALSSSIQVADQMRRAVLELHSSGESSFSRVHQIAASGARLAGDIGAVRGGLSAGALFAQVVSRARVELERIGALAGPGSLEGVDGASTGQLESLAKHYTMQTERDVHESVARGPAVAAVAPAEAPAAVLEDGDLGDNVELF